jgi:hypothetical protein
VTDTDTLIKNKDIAVDSGGRYIHISGDDEIYSRHFLKSAQNLQALCITVNSDVN